MGLHARRQGVAVVVVVVSGLSHCVTVVCWVALGGGCVVWVTGMGSVGVTVIYTVAVVGSVNGTVAVAVTVTVAVTAGYGYG